MINSALVGSTVQIGLGVNKKSFTGKIVTEKEAKDRIDAGIGNFFMSLGAKSLLSYNKGYGVYNKQSSRTKTSNFNGNKVRQNNNLFDLNRVDNKGRTNIQRMEKGLATIGTDGKSINLHHADQTPTGTIQEILSSEHTRNYSGLHSNMGQSSSLIDKNAFNRWRYVYWKWRTQDFK